VISSSKEKATNIIPGESIFPEMPERGAPLPPTKNNVKNGGSSGVFVVFSVLEVLGGVFLRIANARHELSWGLWDNVSLDRSMGFKH